MSISNATKISKKETTQFAKKSFHIGCITPLTEKRNVEMFFRAVEPLCELGFSVSVLAVGDEASQEKCFEFSQKYPHQFEILESIPKNQESIISKSQVILFMEAPEKSLIKKIGKKGVIPMMPFSTKHKEFQNFDAQQESGNCFLYDPTNFWEFLATIIRAYENFKFPYDWSQLRKSLKKTVESL